MRKQTALEQMVTKYLMAEKANKNGEKLYLLFEGRVITYQQLFEVSNKLGNGYARLGVRKGDRVLLMLNNCLEYVLNWMTLTTIGAEEVPVNTAYKGSILEHIINDSGARCMLVEKYFLNQIESVGNKLTLLEKLVVFSEEPFDQCMIPEVKMDVLAYQTLMDTSADPPEVEVNYYDLVAIMYTSGTTGPSKGVKITYRHLTNTQWLS